MVEALQRAISILAGGKTRGGVNNLADAIGVAQSRLSNWLIRKSVPPEFIVPICEATDWQVTPHDFDSDLYPNADDALPLHLRIERSAA